MPCPLPAEEDIPIAYYGTLQHRSAQVRLPQGPGPALRQDHAVHRRHPLQLLPAGSAVAAAASRPKAFVGTDRDYQSARYIALIRNFRRYSWLLMYLFGASPALDAGFLRGRSHQLEAARRQTPSYLPYATSLRMSDLGYQSNAQAGLTPCYNDLSSYTDSLRKAVATPYAPYVEIGTHKDGEWVQLNTNILQIENEYYSNIRPSA